MAFINLSSLVNGLAPNNNETFEARDTFMTLSTTSLDDFIREQAYQVFEPIKKNYRAVLNALLVSGCYDDDFSVYSFVEEHIQEVLVDPLVLFIRDHIFSPASLHAVDMIKKAGLSLDECLSETAGVADDFIRVHEVKGEQGDLCREALSKAITHLYEVVQPKAIENGYDVSFNMGDSDSLIYRSDYVSASIALRLPIGFDRDGMCVFASKGNSYLIGNSNLESNAILLDSSFSKPIHSFNTIEYGNLENYLKAFHNDNMKNTEGAYMKCKEHICRCIFFANKGIDSSWDSIKPGESLWNTMVGRLNEEFILPIYRSVTSKMSALKRRDIDKYNQLLGEYKALDADYWVDNGYKGSHFLSNVFTYATLREAIFFDKSSNHEASQSFIGWGIHSDSVMIDDYKLKGYLDAKKIYNVSALKDNRLTDIPSRYFGVSQPKELTDLFSGSKDSSNAIDGLISAYQVNIRAQVDASNTAIRVEVHKGKVSVTSLYEYQVNEKSDWKIDVSFGGVELQK